MQQNGEERILYSDKNIQMKAAEAYSQQKSDCEHSENSINSFHFSLTLFCIYLFIYSLSSSLIERMDG
jgi:hypothetical protein